MLVLARRKNETLVINHGNISIRIVVTDIDKRAGKVRLAIDAPPEVKIWRGELEEKMKKQASTE